MGGTLESGLLTSHQLNFYNLMCIQNNNVLSQPLLVGISLSGYGFFPLL